MLRACKVQTRFVANAPLIYTGAQSTACSRERLESLVALLVANAMLLMIDN